jgi:predicted nucleic-acid-binding protein
VSDRTSKSYRIFVTHIARQLQVERRDQVRAALAQYKSSKADFADCLIAQLCLEAGSDETVTFDQDAARLRGWRELDG